MKLSWRRILIVVAVVSFGIAFSYPILYRVAEEKNNSTMEELSSMRRKIIEEEAEDDPSLREEAESISDNDTNQLGTADSSAHNSQENITDTEAEISSDEEPEQEGPKEEEADADEDAPQEKQPSSDTETEDNKDQKSPENDSDGTETDSQKQETEEGPSSGRDDTEKEDGQEEAGEEDEAPEYTLEDILLDYVPGMKWKQIEIPEYEQPDAPVVLFKRHMAENRDVRKSPLPYNVKEKVKLDKDKILPELKAIYKMNNDLVGWLYIKGTNIDYPVVRNKDIEYYLHRDFYGADNQNGQIILDPKCDPYTPSYNQIISGHHMNNGSMFGRLPEYYKTKEGWEENKIVEFDNLMERRKYVVFAAFYSADYDEYEEGFRYNADIQYEIDAKMWLKEVEKNQIYDTGVNAKYGDEFVTLTTCDRSRRRNGRFVVVCRRIREGEVFK